MTGDSPRILELRRRVQADPASIAFAQLAEECRRAGQYDEAVGICRAGLDRHPGYLSARVTLGRSLIELGRLAEAQVELDQVVATAPYNLPAIRGLAEIHQRGGHMSEALEYYRRALSLARHDPDLEEAVGRISQVVEPERIEPRAHPVAVEDLFDFDTLLEQLGETVPAALPPAAPGGVAPPVVAAPPEMAAPPPAVAAPAAPSGIEWPDEATAAAPPDAEDRFAAMERDLRLREEERVRDEQAARLSRLEPRRKAVLVPLEAWLAAILNDREPRARA